MTQSRRHDAIALAALALAVTILFFDVLAGTRDFYLRDLTSQYHPARKVLREIVLGGEFPYWVRHFSAGQPLAANPAYQVFYPLTWLILLPGFDFGFRLLILVHLYIAAFGMYALLRSMDIRAAPAALGASSFALGGMILSFINLLPFLFCTAWLPLTCLFARRHLKSGSRRDLALAALFFGVQVLVGEVSIVLQTGLILTMYALSRGVRRIASVALIAAGGFVIAAVQILPSFDHLSGSVRTRGLAFAEATQWSLPFTRLAELLYPNLLGNAVDPRVGAYWGNILYPGAGLPFVSALYPGLLITVAAVAGFLVRRRGAGLAGAIIAVSILLALGSHTPFFNTMHAAGLTSLVRYPEKFSMMAIFAMVVFAARALDDLLGGDERVRQRMIVFAAVVAFLAVAAALFLDEASFRDLWHLARGTEVPRVVEISRRGWFLAAARGLVLLAVLALLRRTKPAVASAALGVWMLLDLGPLAFDVAPRVPAFREPPAAMQRFPADHDRFRVFHHAAWRGDVENSRLYYARRAERDAIARNALEPNATATYGLHTVIQGDLDRTNLLPTADFIDAVWSLDRARVPGWIDSIAAMSNIRWIGIYRPFRQALADARGDLTRMQPVQFLEGRAYPRYYFATELVPIRNTQDFVNNVASGRFDKRAAFVFADSVFTPATGTVRGWRESANRARIDVESAGPAFLVMSVTPHKYWDVSIDGKPAQAVVANVGYQGVVVPRGRHAVEMRYRNPLIPAGAAISLAGLIGLAALARRR